MTDRKRVRGIACILLGLFFGFCILVSVAVPLVCGSLAPIPMAVVGGLFSLVSIPFHVWGSCKRGGKRPFWGVFFVSMAFNTVGILLCEAAYYTHAKAPELGNVFPDTLFLGALIPMAAVAILWVAVMLFPARYVGCTLAGGLVALGGAIACLVQWIRLRSTPEAVLWSFLFFTLLGLIAVVAALYAAIEDDTGSASASLRYLSFASFGLLLLVAAIVLLILMCAGGDCDCDGGCCDGCDCPIGSGGKANKKQ